MHPSPHHRSKFKPLRLATRVDFGQVLQFNSARSFHRIPPSNSGLDIEVKTRAACF